MITTEQEINIIKLYETLEQLCLISYLLKDYSRNYRTEIGGHNISPIFELFEYLSISSLEIVKELNETN